LLGGYSSVTPDGPGYQMRTFCPGLAYGFDLMFDFADFTTALKAEFDTVLNQEVDWYSDTVTKTTATLAITLSAAILPA